MFFDPRNYSGCVRVSSQPLKARNDALAQWRLIPGDNDSDVICGGGAFLVGNSGDGEDKFLDALIRGRVRCAEMMDSPDMAYRLWRFRPAMCSSDGTRFNDFHCDASGAPWQRDESSAGVGVGLGVANHEWRPEASPRGSSRTSFV